MLTKTGAKALYAFAKRLPDAEGFELHFIQPDDDLYSDDVVTSATSMNRGIAHCIEFCPAQYQWGYKRFKRQPEGLRNPYRVANVP
jgi:KDO2-lipid IV(A) lauroyltransferase